MSGKYLWLISAMTVAVLNLSACAGVGEPATAPTAPVIVNSPAAKPAGPDSACALQPQTVEAASVTVKVTPLSLKNGEPPAFDIAMDTHSVDLAADMLKTVVLRDDSGKEYAPTAWDGAGPGGHHREGKIKFAALTTNFKSVTLVVRNLAGVPERAFKWDVAQ
jgi:hypothetical protein